MKTVLQHLYDELVSKYYTQIKKIVNTSLKISFQ